MLDAAITRLDRDKKEETQWMVMYLALWGSQTQVRGGLSLLQAANRGSYPEYGP